MVMAQRWQQRGQEEEEEQQQEALANGTLR